MGLSFIIFGLLVLFLTVAISSKPWRSRKAENDSDNHISTLGLWDLIKCGIFMQTRYRHLANYQNLHKMSQEHGPLIRVNLPGRGIINCMDLHTAKKVMTSPVWQNRFAEDHYSAMTTFGKPLGLIAATDEYWARARKLSVHIFHQLGFYQLSKVEASSLVEAAEIHDELKRLVEAEPSGEVLFCPHEMFQVNTLNVVWQMLMGTRFPRNDPTAAEIQRTLNTMAAEINVGFSIVEFIPFLRRFPSLSFIGSFLAFCNHQYGLYRGIFAEKRQRRSDRKEGYQKDFVDYFLEEIDKADNDEYLSDEALMAVLRDIMIGSLDTVSSFIEHAVLLMALNPEIQSRVQAEIDEIIGSERAPAYLDEFRMPLTKAVIFEILRVASPAPITARTSTERTTLNKSKFAKGTMCVINIWAIHHSETIWPDPYVFRPERFLNDDNQVINTDKIFPFGFGKRMCLGKYTGSVQVFIFFASLLQHFSFGIPNDRPPPTFQYTRGFSRSPKSYWVTVRRRM